LGRKVKSTTTESNARTERGGYGFGGGGIGYRWKDWGVKKSIGQREYRKPVFVAIKKLQLRIWEKKPREGKSNLGGGRKEGGLSGQTPSCLQSWRGGKAEDARTGGEGGEGETSGWGGLVSSQWKI